MKLVTQEDSEDFRSLVFRVQSVAGGNRSNEYSQISAGDDLEAVADWIKARAGENSPETRRRYRTEAKRFVSWLSIERGIALSAVRSDDLTSYYEFLVDPPADSILMMPREAGGLGLIKGGLNPRSAEHAMTVLRGMFKFLVETGYLRGTPFAAYRKLKFMAKDGNGEWHESNRPIIDASANNPLWMTTIREQVFEDSDDGQIESARMRWVFMLMTMSGIRRAEAAKLTLGSFRRAKDGLMLHVIGKGRKLRVIPIPDELICERDRYLSIMRDIKGLVTNEKTPAIFPLRGEEHLSSSQVYRLVKQIVDRGACRLEKLGLWDDAARVREMHPHLFRHHYTTYLMDNGCDPRIIQEILGHEDINTTMNYSHASEEAMMEAVKKVFSK